MRDLKHLIYFESLLENADNDLVKQAQAEGKLAIGYTCYHMPEPLLNLPGCFSVRLRAPRTGSLDIATYYMSNYTCEYARALVERGMEGGYQFLDALAGVDVSKRDEVNAMVKTVEDTFGPISVLVNNAGVAGQALFQDVTDVLWERYFAVNLNGARNTIQAVLPHMLHEKAGVIVNISSIWGQHGASCEVTYSCTKHALIGLTRSLAMELAPSGIRVNCVAPGVIDTDMVQVLGPEVLHDLAEQTPLGRLGTPQDIANAVAFLVSEKASFITGQVLTVDGAFVG